MTGPAGGLRPVSISARPAFYPGPVTLAACAQAAGFSQKVLQPPVTDVKGTRWTPSGLQVILAIAGAESSGNAWAFNHNADGSTDCGVWQINTIHSQWFDGSNPVVSPFNPWDAAVMAFELHKAAAWGFTPWAAYSGPAHHWLGYRDSALEGGRGESWLEWAQHGIAGLNALLAQGQTLRDIASVTEDEAP